jgi:NAD(P)-dependent dehydrogenase (short-subunit alcohol dehydrogenase family)
LVSTRNWHEDGRGDALLASGNLRNGDQFNASRFVFQCVGGTPFSRGNFKLQVETAVAFWRKVMAINLDAHLLGARAIVPLMRKAGGGSIVAIGSDAVGMVTPPGMGLSHYMASKMGVIGLVRALANELAADNIIVNAVHPGITDTEGASGMPNEQKAQVYMQQAIKRLGAPADIAGPVAFLTSDDARFVTGQTLVVDGGWMRL